MIALLLVKPQVPVFTFRGESNKVNEKTLKKEISC
jgi:hypothetical protein